MKFLLEIFICVFFDLFLSCKKNANNLFSLIFQCTQKITFQIYQMWNSIRSIQHWSINKCFRLFDKNFFNKLRICYIKCRSRSSVPTQKQWAKNGKTVRLLICVPVGCMITSKAKINSFLKNFLHSTCNFGAALF